MKVKRKTTGSIMKKAISRVKEKLLDKRMEDISATLSQSPSG